MVDEVSAFNFIKEVLAAGDTAHLVDSETGDDTPYTIPAGYEATATMIWLSFDQPVEIRNYVDGELYAYIAPVAPGIWYENDVVPFMISLIDPAYASSHTVDATVKNLGAVSMKGHGISTLVLEAIGTPPMSMVKTVKCKWSCPGFGEVPVNTVKWTCPICGKETWFYGRRVI